MNSPSYTKSKLHHHPIGVTVTLTSTDYLEKKHMKLDILKHYYDLYTAHLCQHCQILIYGTYLKLIYK